MSDQPDRKEPERRQSRTMSFADIEPVRDTFTDLDGALYDFRSRHDFGATELAKINALQNKAQAAVDRFAASEDDPQQQVRAAAEIDACFRAMIALVIPDLPEERRNGLKIGQCQAIMDFWRESAEQERADEGEA